MWILERKYCVHNYLMMNDIIVTKVYDFQPKIGTNYFKLKGHKGCVSVIIPFYNEKRHELKVTLQSLHYAYSYLKHMKKKWKYKPLKVLIIQDGWWKSSKSMKEYLKELFGGKNEDKWYNKSDFTIENKGKSQPTTYIFESKKPIIINKLESKNNEEPIILMDITMIIKLDNRRKHNSHEWFIGHNGFAEKMESKYLLCTDAFTLFNTTAIYHLVNYLEKNPKCAAVTGRARVMTREQQLNDKETWSEYILRCCQLHDFELSCMVYNGAFSLGGVLPVIPGPCGLYRSTSVLNNDVRNEYFGALNANADKVGIVLGNLKIAEDRLLTYLSIFKNNGSNMVFVPMAIFYFEAEVELKRFLLQRRRWINGSMAGYVYLLLTNPSIIFNWKANIIRKIYVIILFGLQFITSILVALVPGLYIKLLYISLNYIISELVSIPFEYTAHMISLGVYMFFLFHYYIHYNKAYDTMIINGLVLFSVLSSLIILITIGYYMISLHNEHSFIDRFLSGTAYELYFTLLVFLLPYFNGLLGSGKCHSTLNMIKTLPFFYFFSCMLGVGFTSYSFSRTWDISWGNRPTDEEQTNLSDDELKLIRKQLKRRSKYLVILIIIFNTALFFETYNICKYLALLFFGIVLFNLIFTLMYLILYIPTKIKFLCNYKKKAVTLTQIIQEDKQNNDIQNLVRFGTFYGNEKKMLPKLKLNVEMEEFEISDDDDTAAAVATKEVLYSGSKAAKFDFNGYSNNDDNMEINDDDLVPESSDDNVILSPTINIDNDAEHGDLSPPCYSNNKQFRFGFKGNNDNDIEINNDNIDESIDLSDDSNDSDHRLIITDVIVNDNQKNKTE